MQDIVKARKHNVRYCRPTPDEYKLKQENGGNWIDVRVIDASINGIMCPWERLHVTYADHKMKRVVDINRYLREPQGDEMVITQMGMKFDALDNVVCHLGFNFDVGEGMEALLGPRSSTFGNIFSIQTNSLGVIDDTYRGNGDEWKQSFVALRAGFLLQYDRVGQFRTIERMPTILFHEVEDMGAADRGGFGSTGRL